MLYIGGIYEFNLVVWVITIVLVWVISELTRIRRCILSESLQVLLLYFNRLAVLRGGEDRINRQHSVLSGGGGFH